MSTSETTQVYVVTSGSYSDYSIDGIFSTREKAEAFCVELGKMPYKDTPSIEVWALDERVESQYFTVYAWDPNREKSWTYEEVRPPTPRGWVNTHSRIASSIVSVDHAKKLWIEHLQSIMRNDALAPFDDGAMIERAGKDAGT